MWTHWPAIMISKEELVRRAKLDSPLYPYFYEYKLIKSWRKVKSRNGYMILQKYIFVKR